MIDEVAQAKARAPHARQLCQGSNRQLQREDSQLVHCPMCDLELAVVDHVRDGSIKRPVVPSHMPDHAGIAKLAQRRLRGRRPWEQ